MVLGVCGAGVKLDVRRGEKISRRSYRRPAVCATKKEKGRITRMRPCFGIGMRRAKLASLPFVRLLPEILDEGAVLRHADCRILALVLELNFIDHPAIVFMTCDVGDLGLGRVSENGLLGLLGQRTELRADRSRGRQ